MVRAFECPVVIDERVPNPIPRHSKRSLTQLLDEPATLGCLGLKHQGTQRRPLKGEDSVPSKAFSWLGSLVLKALWG